MNVLVLTLFVWGAWARVDKLVPEMPHRFETTETSWETLESKPFEAQAVEKSNFSFVVHTALAGPQGCAWTGGSVQLQPTQYFAFCCIGVQTLHPVVQYVQVVQSL
jgi:hypothetical protein